MASTTKKTKALDLAITQIDRQFGKGSIMKLGSKTNVDIDLPNKQALKSISKAL